MPVRLYSLRTSHPAFAAHLMLAHKRLDHSVLNLAPGLHPLLLRAAGFAGPTVPALELGNMRVQGSLRISRALDHHVAEPRLFPVDAAARRAVEEAERWGEAELQRILQRIFRWAMVRDRHLRRWVLEVAGLPGAGASAALSQPVARSFARAAQATDARVREDLAGLPRMLDRVDALIETGVLGSATPTAADLQIAPTLRWLMAFEQLRPSVEERPAGRLAGHLIATTPFPEPIPVALPASWLSSLA